MCKGRTNYGGRYWKIYYFITSFMVYNPGAFPARNFAAETAPFAKIALEYAV